MIIDPIIIPALSEWLGGIIVRIDPVDVLVTDPSGRRIGYTAATGELNEIPGAWYSGDGEFEYMFIPNPEDGAWTYQFESLGEDYLAQGELFSENGVEIRSWSGSEPAGTVFNENWQTDTVTLDLASQSDTGTVGDGITKQEIVTLAGTTAPGFTVTLDADDDGLFDDGATQADASGDYAFDGVALPEGTNTVSVRVVDPTGIETTVRRTLVRIDTAPYLAMVPEQTVYAGRELTVGLFGSDADGDAVSFTLDQGPLGAVVDPQAGVFTWTPGAELAPGIYDVTARVTDDGSAPRSHTRTFSISVARAATIAGRHVFYNSSAFDGGSFLANARDDDAIASDKEALLPGETASFENYTSYNLGINGVMVDIANLPADVTLGEGDFAFRVGNDDDLDVWEPAPAPTSIDVRRGEGVDGSDRVTIVWPDRAIMNEWLEATVKVDNTGLAGPDVFYFGNAVAEAGNLDSDTYVTATDLLLARNNPRHFLNPAAIDFAYDYDRNGRVNATDVLLARNNQTNFLTALKLLDLSAGEGQTERSRPAGAATPSSLAPNPSPLSPRPASSPSLL